MPSIILTDFYTLISYILAVELGRYTQNLQKNKIYMLIRLNL